MPTLVYANGTTTTTSTGVGNTEYTLASVVHPGRFVLEVDCSGMTTATGVVANVDAGDVIRLTAYQIALTGGTKRVLWQQSFYGPQPSWDVAKCSPEIANDLTDTNALQFTLAQPFGQDRSFPWKILNIGAGDAVAMSQASTYTNSSVTLSTGLSTVSNFFRGCVAAVVAGTGAGQSRTITSYSTAFVATVYPDWATNPSSTSSVIAIYPAPFAALTDKDTNATYNPATDSLQAIIDSAATLSNISTAVLGNVIESAGSYTLQQAVSIILSAVAGMSTAGGATLFSPDGSTQRIAATVTADNRRTAMTLTPSTAAF